jgi:hypothetical protein
VQLQVDDAGFVRAPTWLVYRRLTDLGAWPTWWRGTRARPATIPGGERWLVELRPGPWRRIRVECQPHGWRHAAGFRLALTGDVSGQAEFWLEASHGGTVVHHVAQLVTARADTRRVHDDYRRAIRTGLWGLKDALHLEVRTAAGLRV